MERKIKPRPLPGAAGDPELVRRFNALPRGAQIIFQIERRAEATKDPLKKDILVLGYKALERHIALEDKPYLDSIRAWVSQVRESPPQTAEEYVRKLKERRANHFCTPQCSHLRDVKMRSVPIGYIFNE